MQRQNDLCLYTASMLVWLFLCGCGVTDAGKEVELEETPWHLEAIESVEGEIISTPPSPEFFWIEFIPGDSVNVVRGQDGCNWCQGFYERGSGGAISFSVSCTEAACGIGYGFKLSDATTYELKGGKLRIRYSRSGVEGMLVHRAESR